jgi:hypothetical protein
MKRLAEASHRLAEFQEIEYEELRPRVRYKKILQPETDWEPEEKYSPPKVNGLLVSHEHRNHG